MQRCEALALFAALELGLLVAVQSCGHHFVHQDIKDLVARHVAHQAHMASASWGPRTTASYTAKFSDNAHRLTSELGTHSHDHGPGGGHRHARTPDDAAASSGGLDEEPAAATTDQLPQWPEGSQRDGAVGSEGVAATRGLDGEGAASRGDQQTNKEEEEEAKEDLHDSNPAGVEEEEEEEVKAVSGLRGRSLQQTTTTTTTAPVPAPIRLSVTYQQLGALNLMQQQRLTRVVEAVRRILQKYINVKQPSRNGMLVDPLCDVETWSCFPSFATSSTDADRMCGLAVIQPAHIVNPVSCATGVTRGQFTLQMLGRTAPFSAAGNGSSAYGTNCKSYAGTKGEETDMYMYITAVQNNDCEAGAAAWAKPCLMDIGINRPLLGAANVCPGALELLDEERLTAVLTHEIIHALGFTDSMYNVTRRPDGTQRPGSEMVAVADVGGKAVKLLTSPNVREAARAQFGCPSLLGAQLEDEGNAGSAGSHWEYTHYQGEVMVASTIFAADGSPARVSNLTLAYLDDTGWYVTNRSAAGLLSWGRGAGCDLPTKSCSAYMAAAPGQKLFCDPTAASSASLPTLLCSADYKSTGVCRSLNFTGGCGVLLTSSPQTCMGPDAANDRQEVFGWGTGSPSGRCLPVVYRFQASIGSIRYTYPTNGSDGDSGAACFDTACSANGSVAYVKLLGQQFPCPAATDLCPSQTCSACNSAGGQCQNGVCYCYLSYNGSDCGYSLISEQYVTDSGWGWVVGNGSQPSPPPPPPLTIWTQLVQLTLSLNNSVVDVKSRQGKLQSTIAEWAGLSGSAVTIVIVSAGSNSNSSSYVGTGNSSVAGESYGGATDTSIAVSGSRRRSDSRRRRRARVLQQSTTSTTTARVGAVTTVMLTPSGTRPATTLLGWLKSNAPERTALVAKLANTSFFVVPNGISTESIITQAMDTSSPPPVIAAVAPASANPARTRAIIGVGIAVAAAAVMGIIAAFIVVLVLRHRQEQRRSRTSFYQVPAAVAMDESPYGSGGGAPYDSGFGMGGGGGGPFGRGPPGPQPFDCRGPQGGGGPWPSARYGTLAASGPLGSFGAAAAAAGQPQLPLPPSSMPEFSAAQGRFSPLYCGAEARGYM
ncbi:hypothetical protein VOLCADRAFT_96170 [Volvox carteri f. nagariensis]|uniref:EGF-like domain-containing protein n=1 Tax=Volvox carteri f. nagariensis TaxID=3068 RepID=D8U9E3_VOLCA|nr:uncharacterized protein VOLCADRAFT_96170 [Volvox carteri f. nagariensis]EFJ43569.1 hypothetical protein VOLCADRAFT_96170 [Volvox carteri f. nagariensis]|eukprot:XP_002955269.1 hypothetical protein VOLCADRAFT_96170 [Volvox carteri f. nagariensis]